MSGSPIRGQGSNGFRQRRQNRDDLWRLARRCQVQQAGLHDETGACSVRFVSRQDLTQVFRSYAKPFDRAEKSLSGSMCRKLRLSEPKRRRPDPDHAHGPTSGRGGEPLSSVRSSFSMRTQTDAAKPPRRHSRRQARAGPRAASAGEKATWPRTSSPVADRPDMPCPASASRKPCARRGTRRSLSVRVHRSRNGFAPITGFRFTP